MCLCIVHGCTLHTSIHVWLKIFFSRSLFVLFSDCQFSFNISQQQNLERCLADVASLVPHTALPSPITIITPFDLSRVCSIYKMFHGFSWCFCCRCLFSFARERDSLLSIYFPKCVISLLLECEFALAMLCLHGMFFRICVYVCIRIRLLK